MNKRSGLSSLNLDPVVYVNTMHLKKRAASLFDFTLVVKTAVMNEQ